MTNLSIEEEIYNARQCGTITLKHEIWSDQSSNLAYELDQIAESIKFKGIGNKWIELTRTEAINLLEKTLLEDMAYHSKVMPPSTAQRFANQFIEKFSSTSRFFTNGTWGNSAETISEKVTIGASWTPITEATFDTGVICLDFEKKQFGILWIQDED